MGTHKVDRGETLSRIADLHQVRLQDLMSLNNITDPDKIFAGTYLRIPEKRSRDINNESSESGRTQREQPEALERNLSERIDEDIIKSQQIIEGVLEELLRRLRSEEVDEHVQKTEPVPLTDDKTPQKHRRTAPQKPGSRSKRREPDIKDELRNSLGKEPHVLTFNGVKLTANEKKQILVSVATCEMNPDGFGSINSDQEFVGRRNKSRGIETGYSRILHIGLSYGLIQYTQDSGNLGELLKRLKRKNAQKFVEIFGDGDSETAESLIVLTTSGLPALSARNDIPLSGQQYWGKLVQSKKQGELVKLANAEGGSHLPVSREIRGKRVQPLSPGKGKAAIDIWKGEWRERFLRAGRVVDFQEEQVDYGIETFLDPMLPLAKKNGVRSATGLAFVLACNVRGGVGSRTSRLFYSVADQLGIELPFRTSEDELKCLEAIAHAKGKVGKQGIPEDESRRVKLLMKDELGFLHEDLYDTSTYT